MTKFKRMVLIANTFKQLPLKVQKYIRNNYLIINPDESIIAYYTPLNNIAVEYKNIILTVDFN